MGGSPCLLTAGPGGANGVGHSCQRVVPAGAALGSGPGLRWLLHARQGWGCGPVQVERVSLRSRLKVLTIP